MTPWKQGDSSSSSSSSHLTKLKSIFPSTDAILTQLLRWTKHVGENHTPVLECSLAWTSFAVFTIRYVVDYLKLRRRMRRLRQHRERWWSYPIPLCALAHTRVELDVSLQERQRRLMKALAEAAQSNGMLQEESGEATEAFKEKMNRWNDQEWVSLVQSSLAVRREASYMMLQLARNARGTREDTLSHATIPSCNLLSVLQRLWPRFLEFPEHIRHPMLTNEAFRIAVIVPMYKEPLETIQKTLLHALSNCHDNPQWIQIIIVCADITSDGKQLDPAIALEENLLQFFSTQSSAARSDSTHNAMSWGDLRVIPLPPTLSCSTNGGRGRTLNAGIPHAKAPILTFLHADTLVPQGWDIQIQKALLPSWNMKTMALPQACAFTMGIDMDSRTCWKTPGLLGAQWQGILRCHCGLPYGDSVLSFTKATLEYIGGYPEQPLMEDYEVVDWMRVRSMILRDSFNNPTERLVLLKGQAKCSPRRWQKFGVAYTSLVNAICIHRYRHKGISAEELFGFYYHDACTAESKAI